MRGTKKVTVQHIEGYTVVFKYEIAQTLFAKYTLA